MEKLKIYNEVSKFRMPRKALFRVFERFLKVERVSGGFDVTLVFVGEKKMQELNEKWKGGTGPTDVLSFNYQAPRGSVMGEIYICEKVASRNAKDDGLTTTFEVSNLFAHGLLHLNGWTHENEKKYAAMIKKMGEIVT